MSDEREDLDTLLTHPGWLRVVQYAQQRWTEEISTHLSAAVSDRDDAIALQKMRQVIAAKSAVEQLVAYPKERLRTLTEAQAQRAQVPSLTRGGFR